MLAERIFEPLGMTDTGFFVGGGRFDSSPWRSSSPPPTQSTCRTMQIFELADKRAWCCHLNAAQIYCCSG
ncbi:MAG TPA: hypothetical protein VF328_11550, partial [Mycobacterium sp.]